MSDRCFPVYLGTILLEKNRWPDRPDSTFSWVPRLSKLSSGLPSIQASEWLDRIQSDGFDGVELWENHALMCSDGEFEKLCRSPVPISVYSAYFGLDDNDRERRAAAADAIRKLGAQGVKFNFGPDHARKEVYLRNLRQWADTLPEGVRIICECHRGCLCDTPEETAALVAELPEDRYQLTVHFGNDFEELRQWFRRLGPRIRHVHGGRHVEQGESFIKERFRLMNDFGFSGSFTIEFTTGIDWAKPQPDIEMLYQRAVADMGLLRKVWAG